MAFTAQRKRHSAALPLKMLVAHFHNEEKQMMDDQTSRSATLQIPTDVCNWEGISFQGTAQSRTAHGEVWFPPQHQLLAKTRSRLRPRQTAVACSRPPHHVAKHGGPASARPVTAHPKEAAAARRRAAPTCHPSKTVPCRINTRPFSPLTATTRTY